LKILYFGSACDKERYNKVSHNKSKPWYTAQYLFEMALLRGFSDYGHIEIKIYYMHQEPYFPKGSNLKFTSGKKQLNNKYIVQYIPVWNILLVKELCYFIQGFFLTLKWGINNKKEKRKVVLTPYQYTPLSLGVYIASKLLGIKRANIFTDLSSDIINFKRQKDMVWFKKLLLPIYLKVIKYLEQNYDLYILFTKYMNNKLNPQKKPFIIMEGIFNNGLDMSPSNKERAIMYAGTLSSEYGINYILKAFDLITDTNLQLWIFGDGDMRQSIEDLCKIDKRIKYFGFRPQEEVFEYQKRATLLINLRNPDEEYTKFSFPSKTFEYMVSGVPILTTKLKGIPDEYYDYMYTIETIDINSISLKISQLLSKPQYELDRLGMRARKFIKENKDHATQTKKIINAIDDLFR
jgi:glycosyltransferase involved in cell wall biosynthesis